MEITADENIESTFEIINNESAESMESLQKELADVKKSFEVYRSRTERENNAKFSEGYRRGVKVGSRAMKKVMDEDQNEGQEEPMSWLRTIALIIFMLCVIAYCSRIINAVVDYANVTEVAKSIVEKGCKHRQQDPEAVRYFFDDSL